MTAVTPSSENLTVKLSDNYAPSSDITDIYMNSKDSRVSPLENGVLVNSQYISDFDQPEHGEVKHGDDGAFYYTPSADYAGPDSFVYYASIDSGETVPVTVDFSVLPYGADAPTEINHLPDAKWDSAQTSFNKAVNIDVLGNDKDPDLNILHVIGFTQADNGIVVQRPDGSFDYQPDDDYVGHDEFTYTVSDGNGGYDTAKVNITVNPAEHGPSASNDAAKTTEGQAVLIDVLRNDNDPKGDPLKIDAFLQPTGGEVELTADSGVLLFTPDKGFTGEVFFPYWVVDSDGNRTEAVVSVLVHEAIEIPAKPEASDDQVVTEQNQPVSIAALSNDAAGDSATLALYSFGQPQNGAVTLGPKGNLLYTPHENFAGDDHFGYVITDEHGNKSSATIYMTVTTVNEAPAPLLTQLSTNEDTELSIDLSALIHIRTDTR